MILVSPPSETIKKFKRALSVIQNQEISDIKEQLEKALRDSESRENYVDYLEQRLVIFQDKIDKLNEKILISHKNSYDTIDMAQPGSPRLSLPENQATIQNNRIQREINNIRQYFQSPITITPTINGIVDYLNIISDAGNRFERLVLEIYPRANARAVNAENQAYEAHRTQHNIFKSRELDGRITIQCKTDRAITTHLLNLTTNRYNKWKNKCKTLENDLLLADVQLDNKWGKWKARARNSEQLINNLQQQNLLLHNNPPNMATVLGDLTSIAPLIAEIPNYSRQIPPDEWYQRINQILTLPSITAAAFNDALRADILKSKMAGKYTNIPAQHAGNNIDTPARFIAWLHHKYQTETVGTQQVATQRLAQEKFLPFDNPESYEARIRPLLLGVADNDANILGLLKGHLSGELYTWMKIANPGGITAFFTELKNMWLERPPNLYRGSIPSIPDQISQAPPIASQSTITSREITKSKTEPHSDNSNITRTEIENIVNSQLDLRTQQSQVQIQQPTLQAVSSRFRPQPTGTSEKIYEENINRLLLWLYGETPEYVPVQAPSLSPKSQIKKNTTSNTDSVDEITKGMADMSLNTAKITKSVNTVAKTVNAVAKTVKKSQHRCSNCNRTGHNSRNCKYKKRRSKNRSKKRGSINKVAMDSGSDSNTSDNSDSESNPGTGSSSEESEVESDHSYDSGSKKSSQKIQKNSSTIVDKQIRKIILEMFNNPEIIEAIKKNINNMNLSVTKPNFIDYREIPPEIPGSDGEEETLDDPMEIDFVRKKEPNTSLATIKCKIKRLNIPAMVLDSGAETAIIMEDIVKRIGVKIDKSEKYDLSSIATIPIESIGIVRKLPITLSPSCTIYEDFVVVKHSKPMLIFSNPLFKKYKCTIDWAKNKLRVSLNGVESIFPVTMHRVKNKLEVNYVTTSQNDKPLIPDQIFQEMDGNEDDNIPFEKWYAPAGFNLDSDDPSLKKNT
ncbi:hypothetical protein C2G38_2252421 [Gigaspora rosea]|uniref:CCHC-type domain-containing protein n=1 Tax=Gigaspora rosea TaxID=44941 RepID=A0A397UK84_9GLOM|nr:hypothetical protein C2G38_2252421 [Gigaspora rosea]